MFWWTLSKSKHINISWYLKQDMEEQNQKQDPLKEKEGIYTEEGREDLTENDEISPQEEAFMEGAEDRGELQSCSECGKQIGDDKEAVVEREIDGEIKYFCSEEHAENYAKKHEKS